MGTQSRLTLAELEAFQGDRRARRSGGRLRYFCPLHGSDTQPSLSLDPDSGAFKCFACGAAGYLEEHKQAWLDSRRRERGAQPPSSSRRAFSCPPSLPAKTDIPRQAPAAVSPRPPRADLPQLLARFQEALPGSPGETYLRARGIPLTIAAACGVGYAALGTWPHKHRDWRGGRLVFPHSDNADRIVNLYGRAVGQEVPKALRHDHLPGAKGAFNAGSLAQETVFICEGAFDALSLMAAGQADACAIFGVDGLRWEWLRARRLVFCMDRDAAGLRWQELAWTAVRLGKEAFFLPEWSYAGCKDLNEAWLAAGELDIGEWSSRGSLLPAEQPHEADAATMVVPAHHGDADDDHGQATGEQASSRTTEPEVLVPDAIFHPEYAPL